MPCTELILARVHPADRDRVAAQFAAMLATGGSLCIWHRVFDESGGERTVLAVGGGVRDGAGRLVEVRGFVVDIATVLRRQAGQNGGRAVKRLLAGRVAVEQAKGMLMAADDIDGDPGAAGGRRPTSSKPPPCRAVNPIGGARRCVRYAGRS